MNLTEILMNQLSGTGVSQISRQVGADETITNQALKAAVPLLISALAKNSSEPQGASALHNALQQHDGGILDNLSGYLGAGGNTADGAAILGHVLGNRQSTIQDSLAKTTGMNAGSIGKLLMLLAPMIMGALGKQQRQSGLDPSSLSDYLNGQRQQVQAQAPGLMDMVASLLDSNKDGSVLDDLSKMAGQLFGKK
jgi:hypothetical protein